MIVKRILLPKTESDPTVGTHLLVVELRKKPKLNTKFEKDTYCTQNDNFRLRGEFVTTNVTKTHILAMRIYIYTYIYI